MKARIEMNSCPSISVVVEGNDKLEISIILTETGGANYFTDPCSKLRAELAGTYNKKDLPEKIVAAAKDSLSRGGYNRGPARDFFDKQAAKFFSGITGYERDEEKWKKLRRQIEDRLRKSNSIELLEVAINMGMKLEK